LSIEVALLRPEFWGGVVHEKLAVIAQPVLSNGLLAARKDTRNPTATFPGLSQRIGQFCDALANAIRLDIAGCELLMCKELVTHALEVLKGTHIRKIMPSYRSGKKHCLTMLRAERVYRLGVRCKHV
jgi:hypothetical protein